MAQVACIGGACIDRKYHLRSQAQFGTSNPARARRSFGGVARNVAENLARLRVETALFSAVGDDENGLALLDHARGSGIDVGLVVRDSNCVTPEYAAVIDERGDLLIGVADMRAIDAIEVGHVERHWNTLAHNAWVFVDCNLPGDVLNWCIRRARADGMKLALDAVSEPKVCRLPEDLSGVELLVLNENEAAVYLREDLERFRSRPPLERVQMVRARGARAVILTRGAQGLIASADRTVEIPALAARCVDETGAGDALIAATMYRLLQGDRLPEAARIGSLCAGLTIETPASVRPDLSPELLRTHEYRLDQCASS